jgi:hypothetical protein
MTDGHQRGRHVQAEQRTDRVVHLKAQANSLAREQLLSRLIMLHQLYEIALPGRGGDTCLASMPSTCDALPPRLKDRLAGRKGVRRGRDRPVSRMSQRVN